MTEPTWIGEREVLAIHHRQLSEHGGASGVRDPGLLNSALARPQNLFAYGEPDPLALAAAYATGIIRNHPFIDGNKRTGFVVCILFLELNGYHFIASEPDATRVVLSMAAGDTTEEAFSVWLQEHCEVAGS